MKPIITKALFGAALLAASLSVSAAVTSLDRVIAIVDDQAITESELNDRMVQIKARYAGQSTRLPPDDVLRKKLLDTLVLENIQLHMGDRAGVRISDEELTESMSRLAERYQMNLEQFQAQLAKDGMSYAEAREQVRKEMILSRVEQGNLHDRVQVSDQEVDNYLSSVEGKEITRGRFYVAHILLPGASSDSDTQWLSQLAAAINSGKTTFEAVLKAGAYEGRRLQGGDLGWRKQDELPGVFADVVPALRQGAISAPVQSGAGLHLVKLVGKQGGSDVVIKQTHVRHILIKPSEVRDSTQAKALIEDILGRLKNGEKFEDLAKKYSDDPGSALQGGDLSWASPGQMVPEFEKVMGAAALNQVSAPFQSKFGWHILEVLERRDFNASADMARKQAYNAIYERKYNEEKDAWLQRIRDEAFVEYK